MKTFAELRFSDPRQPVVRKLFKKIDITAPLTRLAGAANAVLSADPER